MKATWLFYIDDKNSNGTIKYFFKSFKVCWAYRWWNAQRVDNHCAITPVKTLYGMKTEKTNYAKRYERNSQNVLF